MFKLSLYVQESQSREEEISLSKTNIAVEKGSRMW